MTFMNNFISFLDNDEVSYFGVNSLLETNVMDGDEFSFEKVCLFSYLKTKKKFFRMNLMNILNNFQIHFQMNHKIHHLI